MDDAKKNINYKDMIWKCKEEFMKVDPKSPEGKQLLEMIIQLENIEAKKAEIYSGLGKSLIVVGGCLFGVKELALLAKTDIADKNAIGVLGFLYKAATTFIK